MGGELAFGKIQYLKEVLVRLFATFDFTEKLYLYWQIYKIIVIRSKITLWIFLILFELPVRKLFRTKSSIVKKFPVSVLHPSKMHLPFQKN